MWPARHTLLPAAETRLDVARVYDSLRSAHLERFAVMVPARVFFAGTRYDFEPSLGSGTGTLEPAGRVRVLWELATGRLRAVELNEPLMTNRWLDLLAQVLVLRVAGLITRRRVRISTYCIDLTDPAERMHARRSVPVGLARVWARLILHILVFNIDRLAIGTQGTWDLLSDYVGPRVLDRRGRLIPAIPAACTCNNTSARARNEVLFVGAFTERKGVRQLMQAWESAAFSPPVSLHLIGVGELLPQVLAWATDRPEVTVQVDPGRDEVHAAYRRAHVVVLPSQRVGYWREQVGLPIVEALAHGCEVVTTDETGLASWLQEHGHGVVSLDSTLSAMVAAIEVALSKTRTAANIMSDLPSEDARIVADGWMLAR